MLFNVAKKQKNGILYRKSLKTVHLLIFMKTEIIYQDIENFPGLNIPEKFRISRFRNGIIVRMPNHLGDAVMALPALAALQKTLPEYCGIFVITPANIMQLYQALPFVAGIVPLENAHRFFSAKERKMIRQLRAGAALLFNRSFRDALTLKMLKIKELYGEAGRGRSWLLSGVFHFRRSPRGTADYTHQAMRYLAMAESLGGERCQPFMPELKIPCTTDELAPRIRALLHHPLMLTMAPGAAYGAAKRWPHEYYTKVAEFWIRHGGIVVLCGSAGERGICEEIRRKLPAEKCFDLSGKTDLFDLMHLFRFSAFVIANDSGLMHLAAALGCEGLTVFGPTDLYDTGPVSAKWQLLYRKQPCSPCLRRSCPEGKARCMLEIHPAEVIRALYASVKKLKLPFSKKRPAEQ